MRLLDKVALIMGDSHGIGNATAVACAQAGADVVFRYRGEVGRCQGDSVGG